MSHEYPFQILERHLDGFGHVNNATYLEIFEEARWDLITRRLLRPTPEWLKAVGAAP